MEESWVGVVIGKLELDHIKNYPCDRVLLDDLVLIAHEKLSRYRVLKNTSARRLNMLSEDRVEWLLSSPVDRAVRSIQGILDTKDVELIAETAGYYEDQ